MRLLLAICVNFAIAMSYAGEAAPPPPPPLPAATAPAPVPARAPETAAPAAPASHEPLAPRADVSGVGNFAKVSAVLYRGEQPTAEGFSQLKKMGVKTVVNLRSFNSDRDELKGTELQYVHIYCKAWHPEDEDVVKFLKVVKDPKNQPVFVHCQHGADRTGMIVASYRMIEQGWSAEEAVKEIHNFGFHKIFGDIQTYLKNFDAQRMNAAVARAEMPRVEVVK